MKRSVVFLAAALALTGCADQMEKGAVTGGNYRPSWVQFIPICTGQPIRCTQNVIFHQESWTLQLDDGKTKGHRSVDEAVYNRCLIGELYPECGAP